MQCPNCHKEAINVNGKYVCLDCGIEITPDQTPADNQTEQIAPTPLINIENHAPQANISQAEPVQPEPVIPTGLQNNTNLQENTVPVEQPKDFIIETPVKDEIQKEIEQASDTPPLDIPTEQENSPKIQVPDFPSSVGSSPDVNIPKTEVTPNISLDSSFMAENTQVVEKSEEVKPKDSQITPDVTQAEQIPITPSIEPSIELPQNEQPITNTSQLNVPATNQESQVLSNSAESQPPPTIPIPNQPEVTQEVPQAVQTPIQPEPENYFQPQSMNINLNNQPTNTSVVDPNFDAMSTPSGVGTGEPIVSPEEITQPNEQASNIAPTIEPPVQNIQMPADNSASSQLDDLLDTYSTPTMANQPQQPVQPTTSFDAVQSAPAQMQQNEKQPGQVPSYESVFGGTSANPQEVNQVSQPVTKKFNLFANKKMLIIIGGAILGLILLIGIIFAVTSSSNKEPEEQNQSIIDQELSTKVQNAMEGEINSVVTFNQTIDFTDIKLLETSDPEKANTEAFESLIKTPLTNKGVWKVNSNGNTELESTINNVPNKQIYIAEDDASFPYNQTTDSWDRNDGFLINSIPIFYGAESRGKLFYMAQVESFENLAQEDIKGVSYDKFKIVPKIEFIESIIAQNNPLLEDTLYNSIKFDSLEVLAWLDKEGKIYKVTVKGSVEVETDNFAGTIKISSTADYDYKDDIDIKKPIALDNTETIVENTPQPVIQKDTEVKPVETTIIKASDKYGGKG